MAWKDLTDNQMVSFTDAQTSGMELSYCQSSVTSNRCMSGLDISAKYGMNARAGYSGNQLVPKGLWNTPFSDTFQFYRNWTGMTMDYNGDVYACTTFPGDIYKLNKSGTPPNFRLMQRQIMDGDIGIRGMTVTEEGYIYLCDDGGDIYKATTCDFNFLPIGGTSRDWMAMTSTTGGIVYACVNGGDIYSRLGPSDIFVGLGQTSRAWKSMTVALNGDVYAGVDYGGIYKRSFAGGDFISIAQADRRWMAMTTAPNGDIYAVTYDGDIYRQPSGGVDFLPLNQTYRKWHAITAVSNGDIYACTHEGGIYKRTGGTGNFNLVNSNTFTGHTNIRVMAMDYNSSGEIFMATANSYGQLSLVFQNRIGGGEFLPTGQTNREWSGMTSSTNGGVWACVWNGGIYKRLGPSDVFVSLGQANRQWTAMTVDNEGNVWACVYDGDIYKQTGGINNFVATGQTSRKWRAMATAANGTIYASTCIPNSSGRSYDYGAIYQYNPGTNSFSDIAVGSQGWVGLAGTPDNNMWAMTSSGNYYRLIGSAGNNFQYMGTTMDADGLCSTLHPSGSGNLYSYRRDYAIIKNPIPGANSGIIYYNTEQSGVATRNNCPEGYIGSTETLIAQAGTFTSTDSVANANQMAVVYVGLNAQNYANTNGTCTAPTGNILFNGYTPALTDSADNPFIFNQNITIDNIVDSDKAFFTVPSAGTYAITLNNIGGGTRRYQIYDMYGSYSRTETFTYGLLIVNGVIYSDMISEYLELTLNANDVISFDYPTPNLGNGEDGIPDFYGNYQFQLIIEKLS